MKLTQISLPLAFVAWLVVILAVGSGALVAAQAETFTATPPLQPTPIPTATPPPTALGFDQALTTYKEIAIEVIKSAERVLDIIKWIIAGIFSLIGVAGGAILYISRTAGQARDSAARSAKAAEDSKVQVERLGTQLQDTLHQVQEEVSKEAASLLMDIRRVVPRLETLANIDTYAMRLLSTDIKISQAAKRTLIELSKDDDPVARRECVRVFGAMPDYPECFADLQDPAIISRLQEMAQKDPERGVQLEARRTLQKIGVVVEGGSKA